MIGWLRRLLCGHPHVVEVKAYGPTILGWGIQESKECADCGKTVKYGRFYWDILGPEQRAKQRALAARQDLSPLRRDLEVPVRRIPVR